MVKDIQFTKDFSLYQLLASNTATRNHYTEQWEPSQQVIENLRQLALHILQPLHDIVGNYHINCAYRCERDNIAVGGVNTPGHLSQHVLGEAADKSLIVSGKNCNLRLAQEILKHDLPFDQMILEGGTLSLPNWIHTSYGPRDRKMILHADFSKPIKDRYSVLTKEQVLKLI